MSSAILAFRSAKFSDSFRKGWSQYDKEGLTKKDLEKEFKLYHSHFSFTNIIK